VDLSTDFFISGGSLGRVIEDERETLVMPEVYKTLFECLLQYREKNDSTNLLYQTLKKKNEQEMKLAAASYQCIELAITRRSINAYPVS